MSASIHHPTGITVEIVGIEANSNGRSCCQHDVCGTLVAEDVVLRLRKVQILNCVGREETAIAAYHVSDGIDQCLVGFLQRHFVAHAKTFDGVLAQVTEVYSAGSDSPIKRKKWRHNMGCCLAALISDFSSAAKCTTSKATTAFLANIAKGEEDSAEEMALLTRLGGDEDIFVSYDDDPRGANIDSSTTMRTQQQHENHVQQDFTNATTTDAPAPQQCHTPPPAKDANAFAKKRREIKERNDLTPSRHSNRIVEKVALAQKNATLQKNNNDSVAASTDTTRNIQSTSRKKVASGKRTGEEEQVLGVRTSSPAPATTTARKLPVKRKKRFGLPDKKKVRLEDLEVRYTKNGTKVYACFSDDSDDEDYVAEDDSY
jgi:hypothetical protein